MSVKIDYQEKYLKYKQKYFKLKNAQFGGNFKFPADSYINEKDPIYRLQFTTDHFFAYVDTKFISENSIQIANSNQIYANREVINANWKPEIITLECLDNQQITGRIIYPKIFDNYHNKPKFVIIKRDDINKKLAIESVSSGVSLSEVASEYKNDIDVVLAYVSKSGMELKHASTTLKNNLEVVIAAVKNDGNALQHVSDTLQDDSDVVIAAVKNDGMALEYASPRLKNSIHIVEIAISKDKDAIQFASEKVKEELAKMKFNKTPTQSNVNYEDFLEVTKAVISNGLLLQHAHSFKDNIQIVMYAVKQNGLALKFASEKMRRNPKVYNAAIFQNRDAEKFKME